MDAQTKSSLLWGVVAGLAFLVLLQGYELLAATPVSVGAKVGVTLLVAVAATVLTYAVDGRLPGNESP
ncbi:MULTISPECIES: hypothetical protein [Haloarcula]|uniref:DUF7981 domain-containing protein n=1 Tax=Haloarcula pellucida TaxID=1427151 RepID=A0A830GR43_9EURY|nr:MULTISPECIES: hypothetical protein [Halomicroarcula]MBX0349309.1 hypothetical protein [Halomicroarcula pellucida]MDS0279105.1 hypothetical protein [Halomicroarcula sp. S1AR25-4]GGN99971.1 hypothetical protein GCM10009030_32140 [Halomicroarcula pellucida]